MENITYNSLILQLEGLLVPEQFLYPTFLFFLFFYVFILTSNVGIMLLIILERDLHEPMYILYCNLPFNDVFGKSVVIPHLMVYLLRPSSERYINYTQCVVQAFCAHLFATTSHTVLMVMAFDRYVAICNPLRYTTIMTTKMVAKLTASAWGVAMFLVAILLGLTIRLNRCGTFITNPYCDNPSLFKLSCENPYINNVYGLTFTVIVTGLSMGSIAFTYIKIAAVCLTRKSKTLNNKALKTCSTHLSVYMIMLMSGFLITIMHRFPSLADYRKLSALLYHIVPSFLNPIIYGLQSTDLKHIMIKVLQSKKVMP